MHQRGDPMSDKINLTPEQLAEVKAFFQQNDFTANMVVEREYNMTGDKAKVFARSKKIFGEYWLGNLRSAGVKRQMKNFSKNYPLNFLENADADFVSENDCLTPNSRKYALKVGEV